MNWQTERARQDAWDRYKKRHPIRSRIELALMWLALIGLIVGVIAGPKIFSWWDCGQVCSARGHDNFYRISQGCYCLDDEGKPYNPKDER